MDFLDMKRRDSIFYSLLMYSSEDLVISYVGITI